MGFGAFVTAAHGLSSGTLASGWHHPVAMMTFASGPLVLQAVWDGETPPHRLPFSVAGSKPVRSANLFLLCFAQISSVYS